ncbi:ABC transporter permease [Aerococcus viridans]|uniref:ABC transporter permease n=1 Tax=Aerococcus viridans TaxID=1377 RepID=UPI000319E272|nr:ABC transporter permease [Aerococcus viridans]
MLRHLLFYDLKIMLRNKEGLLWGLLFPLVYGLVYMFAFQGINNQTANFEAIPVAIVYQGDADQQAEAKDLMGNISTVGTVENEEVVESEELASGDLETTDYPLLAIETADIETAQAYLSEGIVSQAIYVDFDDTDQMQFAFEVAPSATSDIDSSIVYAVLQYFASSTNAFTLLYNEAAASENPAETIAQVDLRLSEIDQDQEIIVQASNSQNVSAWSNFYYVALAYVSIFFMSIGINLVLNNEANFSENALRETVSPTNKYMRYLAHTIIWSIPALLVIYLLLGIYWLNDVPLGDDYPRIFALMTLGPITGLLMGSALAATFKRNAEVVMAVSIVVPLIMGMLSGMMAYDVKVWVVNNVPIINKINPVALINDAFYYLNNYPTYAQYNQNMVILFAIAVICFIVSLIGIRRTDYENL